LQIEKKFRQKANCNAYVNKIESASSKIEQNQTDNHGGNA
jgi:hypothetical protein